MTATGLTCGASAFPTVTRLSPMTPNRTQRRMPALPLWRQRLGPWRRLTTLMRPSDPVRHFCPSCPSRKPEVPLVRVCARGSWWSDWEHTRA